VHLECQALRARLAVQPCRDEGSSQDPRAQGYITPLCTERALQGSRAPTHPVGAPRSNARVPTDQSARLTITGPLSGGATLPTLRGAERTVAEPGARAATTAFLRCCRSAARVPGAASAGRPAAGDHQRQQTARLLAGQQSAAMVCELVVEPELVRHGGAPGHPARREATRLARGAPRASWSAPRVTARGLAREPGRRPSGRDAC